MAGLPQDLMHIVFRELVKITGIEEAAKMRQVSKAWQAACTEYPAQAMCGLKQDLRTLCKILPRMTSLEFLQEGHRNLSVQPLQSFTELTRVGIYYYYPPDKSDFSSVGCVDLSLLPPSIADMTLRGVTVETECFSAISLPELTKLHCQSLGNQAQDIWTVLSSFTQLQVRSLAMCAAITHCMHC